MNANFRFLKIPSILVAYRRILHKSNIVPYSSRQLSCINNGNSFNFTTSSLIAKNNKGKYNGILFFQTRNKNRYHGFHNPQAVKYSWLHVVFAGILGTGFVFTTFSSLSVVSFNFYIYFDYLYIIFKIIFSKV